MRYKIVFPNAEFIVIKSLYSHIKCRTVTNSCNQYIISFADCYITIIYLHNLINPRIFLNNIPKLYLKIYNTTNFLYLLFQILFLFIQSFLIIHLGTGRILNYLHLIYQINYNSIFNYGIPLKC
jgi:hypothetical protein